jgi:hypothetical protein
MADEPFALSTTPPAVPADDDDAMRATLRQTEGGRRFLEEHVRRQRASDPDSLTGAIELVDAVEEDAQPAQTDILAAVERLQDLAWIMREHGLDTATCEHIEALTSAILAAPSLCDPGDRRAQKLAPALGHLERHIDGMIVAARGRAKERLQERTGLPFAVPAPQDEASGPPFETETGERAAEAANDRSDLEPPEEIARESLPPMEEPETLPCPLTPSPPPGQHGVRESAPPDFLFEPMPPAPQASALPQPEPVVAASLPAEESSSDLDDELFASSRIPAVRAAPPPPPAVVSATPAAVPAPIEPTRSDPLAALAAMSEEEKIALFT